MKNQQLTSKTAIKAWVDTVLAAKRWTARSWSMEATGKPDSVRNILRGGSKSPRADTLKKLVAVAGTAPAGFESLIERGEAHFEQETFQAPKVVGGGQISLVGYIGAGDRVYHFGIGETRITVPAPPDVDRGIAAEVRGESMLPVYRHGDMVIGSEHLGEIGELVGKDCFVQVVDGPLYLKIVRKGAKGRFNLESYNEASVLITNQVIEWAAPVAWVKRG